MKIIVLLLPLVGLCQSAAIIYKHPSAHIPGTSAFQTQDNVGNYAFGYHDGKPDVATFHHESGSPGSKIGSYGMSSPDGKVRVVDYIADAGGFRAKIRTNEDKVDTKNPADVDITKAEVKNLVPVVPFLPYHSFAVSGPSYAYVVY